MHFKQEIIQAVYNLYYNNVPVNFIAFELDLDVGDVIEIIDYVNECYN
jgi:hypothetical protein